MRLVVMDVCLLNLIDIGLVLLEACPLDVKLVEHVMARFICRPFFLLLLM